VAFASALAAAIVRRTRPDRSSDIGLLQRQLGLQGFRLSLRRRNVGPHLSGGRAVVGVCDLREQVAAPDPLEVLPEQGRYVARHSRQDRCEVSLQIGVVRRLPSGPTLEVVPLGRDQDQDRQGGHEHQYAPHHRRGPAPIRGGRWRAHRAMAGGQPSGQKRVRSVSCGDMARRGWKNCNLRAAVGSVLSAFVAV